MRRTLLIPIILSLGLLAVTACGTVQPGKSPAASAEPDWRFHAVVDKSFVEQHLQIPMPENIMLIDSRPRRAKYDKGHIPMAVSIPDSRFDEMTDLLPRDKDALLIFYCGGLACKLSHKSARKAEAIGYTNVKVFAEGYPGWMKGGNTYAAVSAQWLKKQIDAKADMVVVDARPKRAKYDKGHIPSAISIPDSHFHELSGGLPADKTKPVVFYCGGLKCKLSHKSAAKAMALGYTNVMVFAEGYPAWKEVAGASSRPAASAALKAGKEEGSLDHAYFKKIIAQNPAAIYLVDVRDNDEFVKGSLKTAVNIPVDELERKIPTLPGDKPIVFICGTGARSGESYYMVKDIRPELEEVYYLDGELTFGKNGDFSLKKPI